MALPDRDMALPDRDMSLPDRDMSLPDRDMSLPDRYVSLSGRVMPFPDCPKSVILAMNQVPVARLGPTLNQDGATTSGKLFKHLLGLPGPFSAPGLKNQKSERIYVLSLKNPL